MLTGQRDGSVLGELKNLGINALEAFVNPFQKAIDGLIETGIKKLMGWLTGPDGILGGLGSISKALGGIFGGAASTAGNVAGSVGGSAGSIAGGAASAGAGAASLGGSLLSGGIAAAGGVAGGLITGFMLTGDLGKIEENTRGTKDQLVQGLQPKINEHLPKLDGIETVLWRIRDEQIYDIQDRLSEIRDAARLTLAPIETDIRNDARTGFDRLATAIESLKEATLKVSVTNVSDFSTVLRSQAVPGV